MVGTTSSGANVEGRRRPGASRLGTFVAAGPQETYHWQLHPQYVGNGALEYQYRDGTGSVSLFGAGGTHDDRTRHLLRNG